LAKIDLNPEFKKALRLMKNSKKNLFITGKAGSGKSTLLDYFRDHTNQKIVVLAPTGVAALNVRGQTIHSFFGFSPKITPKDAAKAVFFGNQELFQSLDALVIDEVSMVRADLLDCMDIYLQKILNNTKPFGGLKIIMIGDLYQLPPVVTGEDRQYLQAEYSSPYFFDSKVMQNKQFALEIVELEKIYRQQDPEFIDLLNSIRNKEISDQQIAKLNQQVQKGAIKIQEGYIYLATTNKIVKAINTQKLQELDGELISSTATIEGEFQASHFPTDLELELKIGAQVMFLNNDQSGLWVNGTIGQVIDFDGEVVFVELENGQEVAVEPYTWKVYRSSFDPKKKELKQEEIGSFRQLPIRLAWAITIHKSQGKTFEKAVIDFATGTFAHGQAYVALSRCRSLEGMILRRPLLRSHILTDWRVSNFLTRFQYAKSEKDCSTKDKVIIIKKAIKGNNNLQITYLKANNTKSQRSIKPTFVGDLFYKETKYLGMEGFCLMRQAERVFRVDRILKIEVQ
jgi:ATP-dependent exoDNAse (exonuclease V) alpha subunit